MKEDYIKKQLINIRNKIDSTKGLKDFIDIVDNIGIMLFSLGVLISFTLSPEILLPCLSLILVIATNKVSNKKISEEEIKALEQERNHLEKIYNDTPKSSESLNFRREF